MIFKSGNTIYGNFKGISISAICLYSPFRKESPGFEVAFWGDFTHRFSINIIIDSKNALYLMKNTPYQNKIDDLVISLISVYRKIPVYRKFWYVGITEKVIYRHTNIGFNTDIFSIPVYRTVLG